MPEDNHRLLTLLAGCVLRHHTSAILSLYELMCVISAIGGVQYGFCE
jgi:hypothetical protein